MISAPRPGGREYRNEGMQLLRLRWGRVVEDLIFEDTLELDAELRRSEHSGEREPLAGARGEVRGRVLRWLGHRRWFAAAGRRFGAPLDRALYRRDARADALHRRCRAADPADHDGAAHRVGRARRR